ncbi:MAG: hypothetical protein P8N76_21765 [Pirellulaceae bacterium]|nr:hypothetical protein [Pirellulaceae bacterium]
MRILRRLLLGFVLLVVVASLAGVGLYLATKSVPEFYTVALKFDAVSADQAGDELEQQVLELHNELEQGKTWELVVTAEQVNGWLATDLEEKFPDLLPPEVCQPRVNFLDGETHIACQLKTPQVDTVLSMALEPYLTKEPNEVAIRVAYVRAGSVPVPLKGLLDKVSAAAIEAHLPLQWSQSKGDPVALLRVPTDRPELESGIVIERIRVEDGKFYISGKADESVDVSQYRDHALKFGSLATQVEAIMNRQP